MDGENGTDERLPYLLIYPSIAETLNFKLALSFPNTGNPLVVKPVVSDAGGRCEVYIHDQTRLFVIEVRPAPSRYPCAVLKNLTRNKRSRGCNVPRLRWVKGAALSLQISCARNIPHGLRPALKWEGTTCSMFCCWLNVDSA